MSAILLLRCQDEGLEDFPVPSAPAIVVPPPPAAPYALIEASRARLQAQLAAHCQMLAELARLRNRMQHAAAAPAPAPERHFAAAELPRARALRPGGFAPGRRALPSPAWNGESRPPRGRATRPELRVVSAPASMPESCAAGAADLAATPARWLNAVLFAATLAAAVGVGSLLWREAAEGWSVRALTDAIERRPFDPSALAVALADREHETSGRAAYARARGEAMLMAARAEHQGVGFRGALGAAAEQALATAAAAWPASPWPRLTLARAAERGNPAAWAELENHPDAAPEFRRALGERLLATGRTDSAVAAFRAAAAGQPEWTRPLLKSLAAARVPLEQRLEIVPPDPRGELAAVEHCQFDEGGRDVEQRARAALVRLGSAPALDGLVARAAYAQLLNAAGDLPNAAAALAAAVERDPRVEWLALLAEWRYRQGDYDACDALAERALARDPHGRDAATARQWRNKARLMRAGQDAR